MSDDLRKQIHDTLNLKETDELMEIWRENDRVEWSETAFDVIREILQERKEDLPAQAEPVYEHSEKDFTDKLDKSSPLRKYLDEENAPVFYDPKQVLWLDIWLNRAAIAAVAITVIENLFEIPRAHGIFASYVTGNPQGNSIAWLLTFVALAASVAFQSLIVYFSLKALASILKILMQMEFSSRGVK